MDTDEDIEQEQTEKTKGTGQGIIVKGMELDEIGANYEGGKLIPRNMLNTRKGKEDFYRE